jgi:hypothetical protein
LTNEFWTQIFHSLVNAISPQSNYASHTPGPLQAALHTPRPIHPADTARGDIRTSSLSGVLCTIGHARKADISQRDVIARVHFRAADTGRAVPLAACCIAGKVYKCNVGDFHQRSARVGAVVTAVLGDFRADVGTLDEEVLEVDVLHYAPV